MTVVAREEPRVAICMEQALGIRVAGEHLRKALERRPEAIEYVPLEYGNRPWKRIPPTVWMSIEAARSLRRTGARDATFFTYGASLVAPLATRGGSYVVGLDGTPRQFEEMPAYALPRSRAIPRWAKHRWYGRVFRGAAALVPWSKWAASSLVGDYGVDAAKVRVRHPGAAPEFFEVVPRRGRGRPRVLFVGGDFGRKGGRSLLRVFERLANRCELVLVTGSSVEPRPGVTVLSGLEPGSAELLSAYAEADIFCMPTLADSTGIAIAEALAAGLPVVSTDVASIPEWVPEEVGSIVPPNDDAALYRALDAMLNDAPRRERMGTAARAWAREHMDADRNANSIVDLLLEIASEGRASGECAGLRQ